MNHIEDIIGNKKYAGAVNNNQVARLLLEQPNKITYEYELFDNISQLEQFNTEKQNSNKFRFYGKISPIMSLNVFTKTITGDTQVNVDTNIFDMNLDNWSIVILRSKSFPLYSATQHSKPVSIKGIKEITKKDANNNILFSLDLRRGLPARTYYNRINQTNACLFFPLGHNFSINDKIYITSRNSYNVPTGVYKIVDIDVDKIFINCPPRSFYPMLNAAQLISVSAIAKNISPVTVGKVTPQPANIGAVQLSTAKSLTMTQINNAILDTKLVVRNLTFNQNVVTNFNIPRPPIQPFIDPEYHVAKVIEKEQLEYYIKVLEVVDVIDELDSCGFSLNGFNDQVMNYYLNHDLNISGLQNNIGEPIYDIYIGIIKNGAPTTTSFGNVESHFNRFIEFVSEGDGLEEITNNATKLGQKVKKGDTFYHTLCEYSTEQLVETEICPIYHKFIHKNVLFDYNPFYKKQLKLISNYIETGDNVYNIAQHAVYSRMNQQYIWRDVFDIGVADEDGNVIDFPFMNGSLYCYTDINLFIKSEKSSTRKYTLNVNDITNANDGGSQYENVVTDILDEINLDTNDVTTTDSGTNNNNNINGVLPYYQYSDLKC